MSTPLQQLEGKYEILDKIREGGMGAIYKVRHRLLEEIRVVKLIRPQYKGDAELQARFLREARTAIRLRHANVAQLYDFAIDEEDNAYIVMEFIDGLTFEELLGRFGPPPLPVTLEAARQTMGAVAYLHRKGFVHRDIAPDNLMLAQDDEGRPLVKLIDLGVAKALRGTTSFTVAGTFLGKVRYASPEQFRTQEGVRVDHRSDIYSFGVVLYELLTGKHPLPGKNLSTLIAGHLLEPPLDFATTDPEARVPEELRGIVLKALAKTAKERFRSANELVRGLERIQERYPLPPSALDDLLKVAELPTEKIAKPRPGSTQSRLDRKFRPETTPAPGEISLLALIDTVAAKPRDLAAPHAGPTSREAAERRQEVELLLIEARVLAEIDSRAEAFEKVQAALDLDPSNGEARSLMATLRQKAAQPPVPRPAGEMATPGIQGGPPAPTEEAASPPSDETPAPRRSPAPAAGQPGEKQEEREKTSRVAELLAEAREALEGAAPEEATVLLEKALGIAPDDALVIRVLADTRKDLERRRDASAVAEVTSRIEAALESGDLEAAGRALAEGCERLGERSELSELAAKLAAAEAEADIWEELRVAAKRARDLARKGDMGRALAALAAVADLANRGEETARFLEEAEIVIFRFAEEWRRTKELAEAQREIESCLEQGELGRARRAMELAEKLFPGEATILGFRHRLEWTVREGRAATVAELLEQAAKYGEEGSLERALAVLEDARELAPGDGEIDELRQELRRREAEATIEAFLDRGEHEQAARALAVAEKLFSAAPSLERLRQRLADLQE